MSVLAHLLVVALIFVLSEVRKFDQVAADTVPVEIVTPQEAAEVAPEPTPSPSPTPDFQLPSPDKPSLEKSEAAAKSEPEQKQPEQKPAEQKQPAQKQAAPKQTPQPSPQPSTTPQSVAKAEQPPPTPQMQPQPSLQQQAYAQPQPDLSLKYGVNLGLPPSLPAAPHAANEGGTDNFDAPAIEDAKVETGVAAEFRRHLKSCLKRPDGLGSDDDVKVKLRVMMTTDGRLAGPPQLIEATASPKGPLMIRSATEALKACQPYAMLPRDRYREWKVLDLDFTPRDFAS